MSDDGRLPTVAVVGRPNVGKSSLVNRVLGRREAIVEERPGVTRDRTSFVADWRGRAFEIFDTGGLEPGAEGLEAEVAAQAEAALIGADVIVLVVDAQAGPNQDDFAVADLLRRSMKPVLLAVNKVDDQAAEPLAASFYRLGLGEPRAVSALHGRGSGDLLDAVIERLPNEPRSETGAWASVAIVGRPNAGKSSMLNALLGARRAIVDARPGTTRDPVDSWLSLSPGRDLRIVDTAGMRRGVQVKDPIEYFSLLRARKTLTRVDAALLVVDGGEGVTGHDQRIAQEILEAGRACAIAVNKWDLAPRDPADRARFEQQMVERLRFLAWAPVVRTSALGGRGIQRVLPALERAVEGHRRRLATPAVNEILRRAQVERPHPRSGGRSPRALYAVQAAVAPPRFVLFANGRLQTDYVRYLENRLRSHGEFEGTPLSLKVRVKPRR